MDEVNNIYNTDILNKYKKCKYFTLSYDSSLLHRQEYSVIMSKFIDNFGELLY